MALIFISIIIFACGCIGYNIPDTSDLENTYPENGEVAQKAKMNIFINGKEFIVNVSDNKTVSELLDMLPMSINMSAMPHEKYFYLPKHLSVSPIKYSKINEGDIMLWGSDCLVLFYETFSTSYSYTKIGSIENTSGLAAAVGTGSVTVAFSHIKN